MLYRYGMVKPQEGLSFIQSVSIKPVFSIWTSWLCLCMRSHDSQMLQHSPQCHMSASDTPSDIMQGGMSSSIPRRKGAPTNYGAMQIFNAMPNSVVEKNPAAAKRAAEKVAEENRARAIPSGGGEAFLQPVVLLSYLPPLLCSLLLSHSDAA